jgi:hypothetical protein
MGRAVEMKIYFMLGYARDRTDAPILAELMTNLRADGFDVEANVAESVVVSPDMRSVDADLYILKSKAELWLDLAARLDAKGARILNTLASSINIPQ